MSIETFVIMIIQQLFFMLSGFFIIICVTKHEEVSSKKALFVVYALACYCAGVAFACVGFTGGAK